MPSANKSKGRGKKPLQGTEPPFMTTDDFLLDLRRKYPDAGLDATEAELSTAPILPPTLLDPDNGDTLPKPITDPVVDVETSDAANTVHGDMPDGFQSGLPKGFPSASKLITNTLYDAPSRRHLRSVRGITSHNQSEARIDFKWETTKRQENTFGRWERECLSALQSVEVEGWTNPFTESGKDEKGFFVRSLWKPDLKTSGSATSDCDWRSDLKQTMEKLRMEVEELRKEVKERSSCPGSGADLVTRITMGG